MTKEIPLSKGFVALVDDADFDWLSQWKWAVSGRVGHAYATRSGYPATASIIMHRQIMNCPGDMVVDHINHNTLDNRRSNLRVCTQKENIRNKQKHKGSHTYKGVSKHQTRWRSYIYLDGKPVNLGHFGSEIEGAVAYDKAAIANFGAFAHLNFSPRRDWIVPVGSGEAYTPAHDRLCSLAERIVG